MTEPVLPAPRLISTWVYSLLTHQGLPILLANGVLYTVDLEEGSLNSSYGKYPLYNFLVILRPYREEPVRFDNEATTTYVVLPTKYPKKGICIVDGGYLKDEVLHMYTCDYSQQLYRYARPLASVTDSEHVRATPGTLTRLILLLSCLKGESNIAVADIVSPAILG